MSTARAKYAIKALLHLARRHGQGPIQARIIADAEGIPRKYLESILQLLRAHNLVRSTPGCRGGHELVFAPGVIRLLTIIRAVDGPVAPLPCLSGTAYARCADCADETACGTRRLLARVHQATLDAMSELTLADGLATGLADPDPRPGSASCRERITDRASPRTRAGP